MNLNAIKKIIFATNLATLVALTPSLTAWATPAQAVDSPSVSDPVNKEATTVTPDDADSNEPETFGKRDYYLSEDLPQDIVAVNRVLDDTHFGNESYFLCVEDLGAEKSYYDTTDNLSYGENNHLSKSEAAAQKNGDDVIRLSVGETLRVTTLYRNDNPLVHFKLYAGSFFPDSLKKGEVKTIWSEVYAEDPLKSIEHSIDRGYNVVPIIADENVILEYVEGSLIQYDRDETVTDGREIGDDGVKAFFVEDTDELGMPVISSNYYANGSTEPIVQLFPTADDNLVKCAMGGYISYKVKVVKAPSVTEAVTEKVKEKANDIYNSEAFQSYNDYMTDLGERIGNATVDIFNNLIK